MGSEMCIRDRFSYDRHEFHKKLESNTVFDGHEPPQERMERANNMSKGPIRTLPEQVAYELYKKYCYMVDELDAYRKSINKAISIDTKHGDKGNDIV